jgi:hypothetical protein
MVAFDQFKTFSGFSPDFRIFFQEKPELPVFFWKKLKVFFHQKHHI